ncbi:hypothetical protein ABVT39_014642 [Epinephelus coioides]
MDDSVCALSKWSVLNLTCKCSTEENGEDQDSLHCDDQLINCSVWRKNKQPINIQTESRTMSSTEERRNTAGVLPVRTVDQLIITMKTVLVLSILLCAAFAAPQPEGEKTNEEKAPARFNFCPRGWEQHGSRCFVVISTSKTWYSAKGQWMWIDQEGFTGLYSLRSPSSYPCIYLRTTSGLVMFYMVEVSGQQRALCALGINNRRQSLVE